MSNKIIALRIFRILLYMKSISKILIFVSISVFSFIGCKAASAQQLYQTQNQNTQVETDQVPPSALATSSVVGFGAATGQSTNSPFASAPTSTTASQTQDLTPQTTNAIASGVAPGDLTRGEMAGGEIMALRTQTPKPPPPGEFENYVKSVLGRSLPRFGSSLQTIDVRSFSPPQTASIPPDYRLNPGDEVVVQLNGSIEGSFRGTINNDGKIIIPKVGAISVAGIRYGDLKDVISRRVSDIYRDFRVSATLGHLHGITIYVTGFAARPGAYTLDSLSTLVDTVMIAGGPSSGGSFRSIILRRDGKVISDFDLYDLLLKGQTGSDLYVQNGDVISVSPVGPQVAISGSVNVEAIYEAKPGEHLSDMLKDAGGLSTVADPTHAYISHLSDLDRFVREPVDLGQAANLRVQGGDILQITSIADYARPQENEAVVVELEGEVNRPGRYYLRPGSTMADLVARAGGFTPRAYIYGAEVDRVSVKAQQQAAFDQAIDNLSISVAASPLSLSGIDQVSAGAQVGRVQLAQQIIQQMRSHKPSGRVVLPLTPASTSLPGDLVLENDDRVDVPPTPTTVGVFGAAYAPGSFLFDPSKTLGDYLRLAGGPEPFAQGNDVFVVRANGSVISQHELAWKQNFRSLRALPGDVLFVPIKSKPNLWWERLVQASTILGNFGIAVAAIRELGQ